jgi:hypothetical protein
MIEQGEQGLPAEDEGPSAPELKFVSSGHFPDRYFIANAFWTSCKAESTVPDPVLVVHIQKLYSPEPYVLYYPGESPVGGCCPVCRQLWKTAPLAIGRAIFIPALRPYRAHRAR